MEQQRGKPSSKSEALSALTCAAVLVLCGLVSKVLGIGNPLFIALSSVATEPLIYRLYGRRVSDARRFASLMIGILGLIAGFVVPIGWPYE